MAVETLETNERVTWELPIVVMVSRETQLVKKLSLTSFKRLKDKLEIRMLACLGRRWENKEHLSRGD
jgi:hypothetical protein